MRTLGCGLLCVNELLYHCTLQAGNQVIANMVISALPLLLLLAKVASVTLHSNCGFQLQAQLFFVRQCTESCTMSRCIFALRMPCQSNEGQTHAKTYCNNRQDCTGSARGTCSVPGANPCQLTADTAEHAGSHCHACNGACNKPPSTTMTLHNATAKNAT